MMESELRGGTFLTIMADRYVHLLGDIGWQRSKALGDAVAVEAGLGNTSA
jgi:hypothetical protein